jgi:hypothetical protein
MTRCVVVSRPSVSVAIDSREQFDLGDEAEVGGGKTTTEEEVVDSGPFEVRATYNDGPFDGRSLYIDVHARGRRKSLISRALYQVGRDEIPRNNYGMGPDGHGFTGLVYIYDPSSAAELQYFCWHPAARG